MSFLFGAQQPTHYLITPSDHNTTSGDETFHTKDLIQAILEGKSSQKTLSKFLDNNYYGICERMKRWIEEDERKNQKSVMEEVIDVNLLLKLDDNVKYDIIEFIPTQSKWKQFENEKEYLKNIGFPKEIVRSTEFYLDSNLVTFHKMRLISKSFNRRMITKILNMSEVFIDLENVNVKLIQGFNLLFAEQTKYLKRNRTIPDSMLYLYDDTSIPDAFEECLKASKKKKKKISLFDDDEDDAYPFTFGTIPTSQSTFSGTSQSLFGSPGDDSSQTSTKPTTDKKLLASSLFGDESEEEDIFSQTSVKVSIPTKRNLLASSLFDDDDESGEDIFSQIGVRTDTKDIEIRVPFKRHLETMKSSKPRSDYTYNILSYPEELKIKKGLSKKETSELPSNFVFHENSTIKHLIINGKVTFDLSKFTNLTTLTVVNLQHVKNAIPTTVTNIFKVFGGDEEEKKVISLDIIKRLLKKRCVGANGILKFLHVESGYASLFSTSTQMLESILSETPDSSILDYLFVTLNIPIELLICRSKQPTYQYLVYLCNKYQNGRLFNIFNTQQLKDDGIFEDSILYGWNFKKQLFELPLLYQPYSTYEFIISSMEIEYDYFRALFIFEIVNNYNSNNYETIILRLLQDTKILSQVLSSSIKLFQGVSVPLLATFKPSFISDYLLDIIDVETIEKFRNEYGDNILHILALKTISTSIFNIMKKLRKLVFEKNDIGVAPIDIIKDFASNFAKKLILSEFSE